MKTTTKLINRLLVFDTGTTVCSQWLGKSILTTCFLLFTAIGFAQIWSNPITGTNPGNTSPYTTGQTVAANITVSGIVRGAGISGASANDRYSTQGYSTNNTFNAANNEYLEFTLTPAAGYEIDFTSFVYTGQASGSGPVSFTFRSSIDSYAAGIGTPTATGTTISLSGAAYQNRTAATTFRLYGWNSSLASGTFSVNDFAFNGTICLRPSISVQPTASQALCAGSALNLSVTAANATSYQWKKGGVNIPSATSSTYSIPSVVTGDAATYTVDVINACQTITSSNAVVTVSAQPTATGGGSANTCSNQTVVSGMTASNGTISWSENGAGSITAGGTTTAPTYTPGVGESGTVTLTMTVTNAPCTAATANYTINVTPASTAVAGPAFNACATATNIPITTGASATNGTVLWTTSGTGTIANATSINSATYTPGVGETGNVTFTLTVTGTAPCTNPTSNKVMTLVQPPTASAGGSASICTNQTATVSGASSSNGTIAWTENGAGSITSGAATLTPTYTPAAGDAGNTVTLTMTVSNATCGSTQATYTVNVTAAPIAVAGSAFSMCTNDVAVNITAGSSASNNSGTAWTSNGTGTIANANSMTLATYTPGLNEVGNITLTLTATGNGPCANAISTKTLTVLPIPVATGVTICQGGSGSLTSATVCTLGAPQNLVKLPGTGTTTTGGANTVWTNPGNIVSDNNSSATLAVVGGFFSTVTSTSQGLVASNFGFNIPADATILSIQATIGRSTTQNGAAGNTKDVSVMLVKGGAAVGTNKGATTTNWPTSEAAANYGSTTVDPLWGTTWTAADVNAANFGLGLITVQQANTLTNTLSVDYMRITVNYAVPGTLNWYTVSSGGTAIGSGSSFNPVGVANSGLANTNTPGTTTFWAECSTVAGCRVAADFVINPLPTVNFTGLAASYCEDAAAVTLTGNHAGGTFTGAGITDNANGTASFNPVIAGVGPHSITYTYTDGNTCVNSDVQSVTVVANTTYYADADNDGFGNAAATQLSCTGAPAGYVANSTDCDDTNNAIHATFPFYADADGDTYGAGSLVPVCAVDALTPPAGYSLNGTDCDDNNIAIYQSASLFIDVDADGYDAGSAVVCYGASVPTGYALTSNGSDCDDNNNAIHETFPFYADADGDTYGAGSLVPVCAVDANTPPAGYSLDGTDCDDTNIAIHETFQFYTDNDGDTYGAGSLVDVCAVDANTPPTGYSLNNTDCNDGDNTVYQSATLYVDADGDTYTTGVSQVICYGASIPSGFVAALTAIDCDDTVAAIHPNAIEVPYNGVDDDCDSLIDETGTVTTTLLASSCGVTLASIQSLVGILTVGGHPITGYRIRITNGAEVQIIEKNVPHFTIPQFPSYAYATTYTVDIQLQRAGIWQASWGTPCFVSTPAILEEGGAASVSPSQCGLTLPKINTLIATTSIAGVTGYRFRITNLTDPLGPNAVQQIDRTQNWFSLQMLTRYNFGTTYRIEVAVKTTGTYGGYGAACEVSSPLSPSLINCGGTVASGTTTVAATSVAGATQYRFQITRVSDNASATIDKNTNWFIFNSVPALIFSPGVAYSVRVAVMTTGTWSPFGDACEITSPGVAAKGTPTGVAQAGSEFKVASYPNPFTSDFVIDVTSSSKEKVMFSVYDMLGKLIESREVNVSEIDMQKVGTQYPSGVYNVIVSQDGIVKTLRVIKR